jgi:hypothetical protein
MDAFVLLLGWNGINHWNESTVSWVPTSLEIDSEHSLLTYLAQIYVNVLCEYQ